jgi:2,3-dihydro-2,3-dihydroxybenzoate dehydrogenase
VLPGSAEAATALVTGAAGGIGLAVAGALARSGRPVAVLDLDSRVHTAAEELRAEGAVAHALVADVTDAASVRAAVAEAERELGPIGVLANVAGVLRAGPVLELDDGDWTRCMAVNATGVWHLGRAVGRLMYERGGGAIVTVASNAAAVPRIGMAAYAASKAAAAMLTRCLALELAPRVRCNIVCPGSTDTAMLRSLWPDPADDRGAEATVAGSPEAFRLGIPLGRIAEPDDVAQAVVFLAGPSARHITLQTLTVDGGATLGV